MFKKIVCPARQNECTYCMLRSRCIYVALFDPPPPVGYSHGRKYSHAPPPYILNPPLTNRQAFHPGETLDFELVLIGSAIDALPYLVVTFEEMGQRGLGRERGRYDLAAVNVMQGGECIPLFDGHSRNFKSFTPEPAKIDAEDKGPIKRVTLHLLTPLRIKAEGSLITRLTFPIFFECLARRITLLSTFYGAPENLPDLSHLIARAQEIQVVEDYLHWYDWERYSARQQDTMKFGGLKGIIVFAGSLNPYVSFLQFAQGLNTGQATTFGLGRYQLETA